MKPGSRLLALAALVLQVHGADNYLDTSLIGSSERTAAAVRGNNALGSHMASSWEHEAAAVINGRFEGISFKARAEQRRIDPERGQRRHHDDLRLLELATARNVGEHGVITLGKTFLNWDVGLSAQPLGFFQWENQLTDLGDSLGQAEGIPLVAAAWLDERFDLTVAYGSGRRSRGKRVLEQAALNLGWHNEQLALALVAQKPAGGRVGVGGTFSWTARPELVVHGSLFRRRGNSREMDRRLLDGSGFAQLGRWREHDQRHYLKSVLGATWAFGADSSLIAEWSYDAAGLDRQQWQRYRQLVEQDLAAYRQQADNYAAYQLYADSAALHESGARRHYLFLQWRGSEGNWSFAPLLRFGEGGSVMSHLGGSYRLSRSATANFGLTHFSGRRGSEYDYLPIRYIARLSLNWTF
ncbi:hypothetical protein [Chitinimonas lacunae]|uniref:DUF3570 domain-containing protein n=1 Tax=Chitinimonas lacunae TaxID=1963018 RepID=A0ABV8MNM3_9NEIS